MGRHCSGEGRGVGCPARKAEVPPLLGESLWERPLLSESLNFLWCGMRQSGSGVFLQLFLCSRDLISLCRCPGLTLMGSPCEETKHKLFCLISFFLTWNDFGIEDTVTLGSQRRGLPAALPHYNICHTAGSLPPLTTPYWKWNSPRCGWTQALLWAWAELDGKGS